MSKSDTSRTLWVGVSVIGWRLAQTFWVGGLWLSHFAVLPVLGKIGLAPLLVEDVAATLVPLLVGFSVLCASLQVLLLLSVEGWGGLWRDLRGQLLLGVLGVGGAFLAVRAWLPDAQRLMLFGYLLLAFFGALLVLQPGPGESRRP